MIKRLMAYGTLSGFLVNLAAFSDAPKAEWAFSFSGGYTHPSRIDIDPAGNIVLSTYLPQAGSLAGANAAGVVVLKVDRGGNIVWKSTVSISGQAGEHNVAIACAPHGEMYVASGYSGFNGTPLLSKFSEAGTQLWSKGGSSGTLPPNAATDSAGNCLASFGLNRGTLMLGSTVIDDQSGYYVMALVKVAPDGSVVWTKRGTGNVIPLAVAVDAQDNVLVAGRFDRIAGFSGIALQPSGRFSDGFLAKYDQAGNIQWAQKLGGPGADSTTGIATDKSTIWVAGEFSESITIGTSNLTYSGSAAFAASFDENGTVRSAFKIGSTASTPQIGGSVSAPQIQLAPDGNVIIAGAFSGILTFSGTNITSAGVGDLFLAKLRPDGTAIWAQTVGFTGGDQVGAVRVSSKGEIYLGGSFQNGLHVGSIFLDPTGTQDAFLAKFNAEQSLPVIKTEPETQRAAVGGSVSFTVAAEPTNSVNYQWFFNTQPIPSATNATLTLPSVTLASAGSYFVDVTLGTTSVRSSPAQLIVSDSISVLVSTLAGTNSPGLVDSADPHAVRFNQPNGLEYWSAGVIAVADGHNHAIRLVDLAGATVNYAGTGVAGYNNGPATLAQFDYPLGLNVDKSIDILVADTENNLIRRIDPLGLREVTTFAGSGVGGYRDGAAAQAQFNFPNDLVTDTAGNVFVTEFTNHTIRKITPDGTVSTFAGNGTPGFRNGTGTNALFNMPAGLAIDAQQNLFVTEWHNHSVRKITPDGVVTTMAGGGGPGFVDGQGSAAKFNTPDGIAIDPLGNLYLVEHANHAVRKVDQNGNVLTIAGLGTAGFKDGDRTQAMFNSPAGIMCTRTGACSSRIH